MRIVLDRTGWSAERWAKFAGTSATNITRFLRHDDAPIPSTRTLAKLRGALRQSEEHVYLEDIESVLTGDQQASGAGFSTLERRLRRLISRDYRYLSDRQRVQLMEDLFGQRAADAVKLLSDTTVSDNDALTTLVGWSQNRHNLLQTARGEIGMEIVEVAPPALLDRDIEVWGVAVGGDDGDFRFNGQVVDYVRRPPGITAASGVFAIHLMGDSMSPRYENGDLLFISTHKKVSPGDDVLIEMHDAGDGPGPCYVKRLVRRTSKRVLLKQFNPPRDDIEIPSSKVRHIYKVLTPAELLGV